MTGSECSADCLRTVVQATDRSFTRRLKPSSAGSHLFVHARRLRIRIRGSPPLFALIRGG